MARFQRGFLRKENRKAGPTWVLRYYITREADGKRVENTMPIGLVTEIPSESAAWGMVEDMHLQLNESGKAGRVTFANLAESYIKHELGEDSEKSHTTIGASLRILKNRLIPRWGKRTALGIKPLEVKEWLQAIQKQGHLENPTMVKIRNVMSLVFKHGQMYDLIPRTQEANPVKWVRCKTKSSYRAIILTVGQTFTILENIPQPERTLTLLIAATGLRISECLGLQWQDVDYANQQIYVRRKFTGGKVGSPKTEASEGVVPLHPLLAGFLRQWQQQTPYAAPTDWVFPSQKLKGQKPRVANMLVEDYLRPAAVAAGALKSEVVDGKLVDIDPRRFGFHNLRHSLSTFLVGIQVDPKTVQALLRHSDVKTTLQLYTQSVDANRLAAQAQMLKAILKPSSEMVN